MLRRWTGRRLPCPQWNKERLLQRAEGRCLEEPFPQSRGSCKPQRLPTVLSLPVEKPQTPQSVRMLSPCQGHQARISFRLISHAEMMDEMISPRISRLGLERELHVWQYRVKGRELGNISLSFSAIFSLHLTIGPWSLHFAIVYCESRRDPSSYF